MLKEQLQNPQFREFVDVLTFLLSSAYDRNKSIMVVYKLAFQNS